MKFTIETAALAKALNIASVAIMSRTTLPVLGNVKIEAKDSRAIFSATDLDLWASASESAQVQIEGATTVPFELLQRLVARLKSSQSQFEIIGKEMILRSGDVNAVFETVPADEFPPRPPQKKEKLVRCNAKEIIEPFAKLAHAMSKDQTSYALMGINVAGKNGGSAFAATNRRRLAIFKGSLLTPDNIIIGDAFVRAILQVNPTGELDVVISDGLISVVSENTELVSKLIEAKFPNWEAIIPEPPDKLFACNRKELIDALRTCAIFSEREVQALSIVGKGKEIEVFKDDRIKARVMGTELSGQPKLTMRFNYTFLLDVLSVLENEIVNIRCSDASSPMVIEEGAFKSIIMPMAQ